MQLCKWDAGEALEAVKRFVEVFGVSREIQKNDGNFWRCVIILGISP